MIKALKVISVSSLLLAVSFTALYIVGSKEQETTSESVKPLELKDNQSYVTYSHSNEYGHWFIDSSISDDAILFVDDTLMEGIEESERYLATYVDADKWELVGLDSVTE